MANRHELLTSIRSQGRRLTRQRELVFEILKESNEHLDAEAIFERARKRGERIGIATIYRNLAFLKEIGLVDEHQFGEDHGHFEAAQIDKPHYHFTCIKCKKIVEFQAPQVMKLARKLCQSDDLQVVEVHLHFRGYCGQCRPDEQNCE